MKIAMLLSTLLFASYTFASNAQPELVGVKMQVSVDDKLVSSPQVSAMVGENFMVAQESENGFLLELKGEVYNCGDGTYTIHINYAYKSSEAAQPLQGHMSITTVKNQEVVIASQDWTVEGSKVELKLMITDPM